MSLYEDLGIYVLGQSIRLSLSVLYLPSILHCRCTFGGELFGCRLSLTKSQSVSNPVEIQDMFRNIQYLLRLGMNTLPVLENCEWDSFSFTVRNEIVAFLCEQEIGFPRSGEVCIWLVKKRPEKCSSFTRQLT